MDEDAVKLVENIKGQVDVLNYRIADAVFEYFTSNEFNALYMFQSELADKRQCYLLDVLKQQLQLRDYEVDWIYNTIYETIFGNPPPTFQSESDEESSYTDDELLSDEEEEEEEKKQPDNTDILLPSQINPNLNNYELSKFKTFLAKHYPRLHHCTADGDARCLVRVMAIGRKHNIDLIALMFDIFTEARIWQYYRTKDAYKVVYLIWKEFVKSPSVQQSLPQAIFKEFDHGMAWYARKFAHVLMLNSLSRITDPYYSFVTYTFALSAALRRLQHLFRSGAGCPLQVDFWIIPNTVIQVCERPVMDYGSDADYVDDDEDDDHFIDELNAPNSDDNDPYIGKIEQRLDSVKIEYIKEVLMHNEQKSKIVNKMFNALQFITKKEYKFKRIVMIIDRRHSSTKLNKNSDRMYVYQPNKPYGEIPHHEYCHETFHSLSMSFLLPKLVYEDRTTHLSCKDNVKGRMFTLSFHIKSWDTIRCYQYMQSGSTSRFFPKYLYQVWPTLFFKDTNRDGFEKITKEVVQKEWKLPLNDKIFEVWYPVVSGNRWEGMK
eukprot:416164_1